MGVFYLGWIAYRSWHKRSLDELNIFKDRLAACERELDLKEKRLTSMEVIKQASGKEEKIYDDRHEQTVAINIYNICLSDSQKQED